jgi:hypothetical protein
MNSAPATRCPAVVQQQQRIHPTVNRARGLATHHPKQMRSVPSCENRSAHASQRIRSERACKDIPPEFHGFRVYQRRPQVLTHAQARVPIERMRSGGRRSGIIREGRPRRPASPRPNRRVGLSIRMRPYGVFSLTNSAPRASPASLLE